MFFDKSFPFPKIPAKIQNICRRRHDIGGPIPFNVGNEIH